MVLLFTLKKKKENLLVSYDWKIQGLKKYFRYSWIQGLKIGLQKSFSLYLLPPLLVLSR